MPRRVAAAELTALAEGKPRRKRRPKQLELPLGAEGFAAREVAGKEPHRLTNSGLVQATERRDTGEAVGGARFGASSRPLSDPPARRAGTQAKAQSKKAVTNADGESAP